MGTTLWGATLTDTSVDLSFVEPRGPNGAMVLTEIHPDGTATELPLREETGTSATFQNDSQKVSFTRNDDMLTVIHEGGADGPVRVDLLKSNQPNAEPLEIASDNWGAESSSYGPLMWITFFEPGGSAWTDRRVDEAGLAGVYTQMKSTGQPLASVRLSRTRGDLGVALGETRNQPGENSGVNDPTGSFATVWHRQPDGTWKVRFDVRRPDVTPRR